MTDGQLLWEHEHGDSQAHSQRSEQCPACLSYIDADGRLTVKAAVGQRMSELSWPRGIVDALGDIEATSLGHGKLCGVRALGCGPCQLLAGHDGRHLCDHYAKGGVELHDPADRGCACPDCTERGLKADVHQALGDRQMASERYFQARSRLVAFQREHPHG